jgi:hypothetical protein
VFELAVMRNQQMQELSAELCREVTYRGNLLRDHDGLHRQMTQQLAVSRVPKPTLVTQFIDLAKIMQHCTRLKKVDVYPAIVLTNLFAESDERKRMLEQTTQVRVMHRLRGGRPPKLSRRFLVGKDILEKLSQVGVIKSANRRHEFGKHLIGVVRRSWEVVRQIDLTLFAAADTMHCKLQVIAVAVDLTAHIDNVIAIKSSDHIVKVVPPLRDNVPGSIRPGSAGRTGPSLLGAQLLRFDKKSGADVLVRNELIDKGFHDVRESQGGNARSRGGRRWALPLVSR